MDFDAPLDENLSSDVEFDDVVYHGKADNIDYHKNITPEGFSEAETTIKGNF